MWERITRSTALGAVLDTALREAAGHGARRVGTDHLVLGLLHAPDTTPARALGITLTEARAALYALDRTALATVGIDIDRIDSPEPPARRLPLGRNSLTPGAWTQLRDAIDMTGVKTRRRAPNHLLRSLLTLNTPDPAAQLLTGAAVDRTAAAHRLAELDID